MAKDPKCSELGIPERLHRLDRPEVQQFKDTELLFRRYDPSQVTDKGLAVATISFQNDGMSVNRERFSESPKDVLFNTVEGGTHEGHRVLSFQTGRMRSFTWIHPDAGQRYTLEVLHDPEQCMYPHTLIKLLREGQPVEGVKSAKRKLQLKEEILALSVASD